MTAALGSVLLGSTLLAGAGAAAARTHAPAGPAVAAPGTWGTAIEVPGIAALNAGGAAAVTSVSCAVAGTCSAGGSYTDSSGHVQAFVVDETGGTWGTAQEVPGTAALNVDGRAVTTSVSCAAAGGCSAGGYYTDGSGHVQAFVVDETGGTWGTAQKVPGTAALNAGVRAVINSLSCRSAGNCGAGGYYTDSSGNQQAFVVDETGGTWGTAQAVPGIAALDAGGHAGIQSVSCGSAGDCGAGGYYASSTSDGIPTLQAFVVSETGGTWGTAQEVPGTAALNGGGFAEIYSVSCASAGNCSAGGDYTNSRPATEAFMVTETNGTWGNAKLVPGIATLNKQGLAQVSSVSCTLPGNCSAGGFYQDGNFKGQAFVVGQRNGSLGTAREMPGTAALNQGGNAATSSVSCAATGNCGAGGIYTGRSGSQEVFVVSERSGSWGTAEEVPGIAALNTGGLASLSSVSCASPGTCSAGGKYTVSNSNATEAFVVSETKS